MNIVFSAHGERAFSKLSRKVQERVILELTSLSEDHFWYRRVRKLKGTEDRFRLRVGRWRVLFEVKGEQIEVMDIFLRKEEGDYRRRSL